MKNYLRILEISQVSHRNLRFKKLDLSKLESGHLRILGGCGSGKTNFMELLRLATEDRCKLRDKHINPDDIDKASFEIMFSDNFYIGFTKTLTGDFTTKLYRKEGDKKIAPAIGERELTVTDYKRALTTELTYGLSEFLSDNLTVQWDFLQRIYQDQLEKLGLIGDAENKQTLTYKLNQAISRRDAAQAIQSKLGAYYKHLKEDYGLKCPDPIDITALENKIKDNQKKIQVIIEKVSALNIQAQQDYTKKLQAWTEEKNTQKETLTSQINEIEKKIGLHNQSAQSKYDKAVKDITSEINEQNRLAENIETSAESLVKALREYSKFLVLETNQKSEIEDAISDINGFPIYGLRYGKTVEEAVDEIPEPVLIQDQESYSPGDIAKFDKILDGKFSKLLELYEAEDQLETAESGLTPPIPLTINQDEILKIPAETHCQLHTDVVTLINDNVSLNLQIVAGKESNKVIEKFEAYEAYTKADEEVSAVRQEIKKAYLQVNTGVQGMTLVYDDESGHIIVMYDGRSFERQVNQPLSSYSHTEKRFIALELQLYLLSKKERPLNVIYLDELGLDSRTCEKITNFAKEHGLLIITASTGDYEPDKLGDNEILIEDGHLVFGDKVEDFTPEELTKLRKEKDDSPASEKPDKTTKTGKKGKLHQRTIEEEIAEREAENPPEIKTEPEKKENKPPVNPIDLI